MSGKSRAKKNSKVLSQAVSNNTPQSSPVEAVKESVLPAKADSKDTAAIEKQNSVRDAVQEAMKAENKEAAKEITKAENKETPKTKGTAAAKTEKKAATTRKPRATKAEKETAEKEVAVKEKPAEKKTEKKATAKPAAGKTSAKTSSKTISSELHVEFDGKSYTEAELVKIAKDVWKYDLKNKVSDFHSVKLYMKPAENACYYVINDDIAGKFQI